MARRRIEQDDSDYASPTSRKKPRRFGASTIPQRLIRPTAADAPRQAVFNTVELLEALLIYLPAEQLIISRRVCYQFRDVIDSSKPLNQKLYIGNFDSGDEFWLSRRGPIPGLIFINVTSGVRSGTVDVTNGARSGHVYQVATSNTLVGIPQEIYRSDPVCRQVFFDGKGETVDVRTGLRQHIMSYILGERAQSWEDMHLTDPPTVRLEFTVRFSFPEERLLFARGWLPYERGLTIGKIVQGILDHSSGRDRSVRILCKGKKAVHPRRQTVRHVIEMMRKEWAQDPVIVHMRFVIPDLVIPTEWERRNVRSCKRT